MASPAEEPQTTTAGEQEGVAVVIQQGDVVSDMTMAQLTLSDISMDEEFTFACTVEQQMRADKLKEWLWTAQSDLSSGWPDQKEKLGLIGISSISEFIEALSEGPSAASLLSQVEKVSGWSAETAKQLLMDGFRMALNSWAIGSLDLDRYFGSHDDLEPDELEMKQAMVWRLHSKDTSLLAALQACCLTWCCKLPSRHSQGLTADKSAWVKMQECLEAVMPLTADQSWSSGGLESPARLAIDEQEPDALQKEIAALPVKVTTSAEEIMEENDAVAEETGSTITEESVHPISPKYSAKIKRKKLKRNTMKLQRARKSIPKKTGSKTKYSTASSSASQTASSEAPRLGVSDYLSDEELELNDFIAKRRAGITAIQKEGVCHPATAHAAVKAVQPAPTTSKAKQRSPAKRLAPVSNAIQVGNKATLHAAINLRPFDEHSYCKSILQSTPVKQGRAAAAAVQPAKAAHQMHQPPIAVTQPMRQAQKALTTTELLRPLRVGRYTPRQWVKSSFASMMKALKLKTRSIEDVLDTNAAAADMAMKVVEHRLSELQGLCRALYKETQTLAQARADEETKERLRAQLDAAAGSGNAWSRQLSEERQLRQSAEVEHRDLESVKVELTEARQQLSTLQQDCEVQRRRAQSVVSEQDIIDLMKDIGTVEEASRNYAASHGDLLDDIMVRVQRWIEVHAAQRAGSSQTATPAPPPQQSAEQGPPRRGRRIRVRRQPDGTIVLPPAEGKK